MKVNKQNGDRKEVLITYGDDNSINVNIFNNKILMEIVGSLDSNLKELEKLTGSKIYFRGNSIAIKGDKYANERVKDAIEYLIDRFRSDKKIDRNDIISSLNKDMMIGLAIENPVYFTCMMVGAMKSLQINLSIILGAILGPAFFFISPEWSILYGGVSAGTIAYFVGELK